MIEINDVIRIHKIIIEETGGSEGLRDFGLLESALNRPFQEFSGQSFYKSIVEQAAILLEGIIRNHPFVDGNKRIGYVLFSSFLVMNGYDLDASENEKYGLIINVADGTLDSGGIIEWINNHLKTLK